MTKRAGRAGCGLHSVVARGEGKRLAAAQAGTLRRGRSCLVGSDTALRAASRRPMPTKRTGLSWRLRCGQSVCPHSHGKACKLPCAWIAGKDAGPSILQRECGLIGRRTPLRRQAAGVSCSVWSAAEPHTAGGARAAIWGGVVDRDARMQVTGTLHTHAIHGHHTDVGGHVTGSDFDNHHTRLAGAAASLAVETSCRTAPPPGRRRGRRRRRALRAFAIVAGAASVAVAYRRMPR